MFKEGVKYKLSGYKSFGVEYTESESTIAEYKSGMWYKVLEDGRVSGKSGLHFTIKSATPLREYNLNKLIK